MHIKLTALGTGAIALDPLLTGYWPLSEQEKPFVDYDVLGFERGSTLGDVDVVRGGRGGVAWLRDDGLTTKEKHMRGSLCIILNSSRHAGAKAAISTTVWLPATEKPTSRNHAVSVTN